MPTTADAETVSQKEASHIAQLFFNHLKGQASPKPDLAWNGKKLTTHRLFTPFYVYNHKAGGYVVVSAENKAWPILAWSPTGKFDADNSPAALTELMRQYAFDIERIRYDAEPVDGAIKAWQNLPEYIAEIVSERPIDVGDSERQISSALETLASLAASDEADPYASDIYSPSQWEDMIDNQIADGNVVAIALASEKSPSSIVATGRRGDYYLLNGIDGLWRMRATEIFNDGQLASFNVVLSLPDAPEEVPFAFLDEIMSMHNTRGADNEATMGIIDTDPVVIGIGGGRYMVTLPQNAVFARIYNISGACVEEYRYKGSPIISIDMSAQPSGFYIADIATVDGRHYGLKLSR